MLINREELVDNLRVEGNLGNGDNENDKDHDANERIPR